MGLPAAKLGDRIVGVDVHTIMIPTLTGDVPTPTPSPFTGVIASGVCTNVLIEGKPAAVVGSTAINTVPHVAAGGRFALSPSNQGMITAGSSTVIIGGKPAARLGDPAITCSEAGASGSSVMVQSSTVFIG